MFDLIAAVTLLPLITAAQSTNKTYTVWSSVIFSRTGERTPLVLGDDPTVLTSLGAQQQYNAGAFFRDRYISSNGRTNDSNGISAAPIVGLDADIPDVQALYVLALDQQTYVASAQAFLQGLYPPVSWAGNDSDVQQSEDPLGKLANSTYIAPPLDGYRYAQIHSSWLYDPEYVYVGGNLECPALDASAVAYFQSPEFEEKQESVSDIYQDIGPVLLEDVLSSKLWDYTNAYAIYDYLNYKNKYDIRAQSLLADPSSINPDAPVDNYLDSARWLADQHSYNIYGNLEAQNVVASDSSFVSGVQGSISTIAGNMLAAKMLSQLQAAIQNKGEYYKLSLLFGEFQPLMSFFALANLPSINTNFYGPPNFASVAAFELYSMSEPNTTDFPNTDDLWVNFYFKNGTAAEEPYQAYPLFGNGPDGFEMPWTEFEAAMLDVAVGNIGDWCQQCGASYSDSASIFCTYWDAAEGLDSAALSGSNGQEVSPAVGGVIGAIVALVVAGLLFGLVMLLGGVRLHRIHRSHKSEMGGFKGSQKMASDKDLVLPKGGAVVGATVETSHERVGSWELKQNDGPNLAAAHPAERKASFEEDGDLGVEPFREPVRPEERV